MHFETELKLRLAPQKNAAFRRLMATHAPAPSRKHIVSHYYDTATLELARHNMALSLRRQDGQWVQAIHLDDTAGSGLHQRLTFEAQVASQAIDLANITDEATRRFLLQDKIAQALRPLFTTDVQRTKWHLEDENGNELEVVLDHGTIVGDTQTHKINEVKLGLRQGQASALFDLALALGKHFSMMPEPLSKVAQGSRLNQPAIKPAPSKAQLPKLTGNMPSQQAMQAMAYETLRHLQANVPGVLDDHDIEFVHQARVALRRLRSLQKIFPSLVPHHDRENVLSHIKELAATLGQVRDLDVFLTETLPPLEEALAMSTDFTPLKAALARARQHCQNKVVTALTSPDYGRLLIQLLAGLHAPQSATEKPNGKLRDVAGPALSRRRKPIKNSIKHWQSLAPVERHDLRKRAKKLRYAIEFFSPLYPRQQVNAYLSALEQVQSVMGAVNDHIAGQALMKQLAQQDPELQQLAGIVIGWLAHAANQSETTLGNALDKLASAKAFW